MKYLMLVLLALSGCALLDGAVGVTVPAPVTITPSPNPTPVITPTQEIIVGVPVNYNYDFTDTCPPGPVRRVGNRDVCKPASWRVVWIPNPAIFDPNPHPEVLPIESGGMRFEISNRGGAFGFGSDVFCVKRCIIVAEYIGDITPRFGSFLNSNDYYGYCRFDDNALSRTVWRGVQQGEGEFICAFEVETPRFVRFDALLNMTWQVVDGGVNFVEIRAEHASADAYADSVIMLP